MQDNKRLGKEQRLMLSFLDKYSFKQGFENIDGLPSRNRRFSIASDRDTRRVALSLAKRNLIKIVDNAVSQWTIIRVY